MSGISMKFKSGPITFAAGAAITGGQVVQAGTVAGEVVPATAGSTTVLGVALTDAAPKSAAAAGVLVVTPEHVAVANGPAVVPVASDGSAGVGDLVVAAAGGTVVAAADEGPAAIVGRVIEKKTDSANTVLVRLGL